jgi:hypothetical protein
MTGKLPDREADHRDRDGSNDRWRNIRPATRSQNTMNRGRYKTNTSGFKWVSWHIRRKMYIASVSRNKKRKHLGYYLTAGEAYAIAKTYAEGSHGQFFTGD